MLDVGWSELLLIGIVALIVVGPKDLPRMFHTLGRFTGKLRSMAREFQSAMDDAARSSGFDEMRRDMGDIVSKKNLGLDKLDAVAGKFEKWDPTRAKVPPATAAAAGAATRAEIRADQALADEIADSVTSGAASAPAAVAKPSPETPVAPKARRKAAALPAKASPAKPATAKPAAAKSATAKPAARKSPAPPAPAQKDAPAPAKPARKSAAKPAAKAATKPARNSSPPSPAQDG